MAKGRPNKGTGTTGPKDEDAGTGKVWNYFKEI